MSGPAGKIYRAALAMLLVLVLCNALAAGLRTVSDNDMGWHLATGRWVVQHHAIPSTDVLSYTAAGTPWIYPPFAGVLLYLIYCASGYAGLSAFCALACVSTVAYLVRRRDPASLVLAMCAIEPIAFRTGPRADLFNTVFLALFLGELWAYQRGESKRLWPLPLVMLFWVNLHPGFILGLAVVVAYLFLEVSEWFFAERRAAARQRLRQAWPWLAGTAAVTVINPYGLKLYSASLALAGVIGQQQGYKTASLIQEFLPVPLSSHLLAELANFRSAENGFVWLMAIAVVVVGAALWRKQFGAAVIQGGALYLAVEHARYIGLFCVTTVILGATLLAEAVRNSSVPEGAGGAVPEAAPSRRGLRIPPRISPRIPPRISPRIPPRIPPIVALVFVCAAGAIALLHTVDFVSNRTHVVFHTKSRFGVGEANWYPERAASFIRRERLPGNIFEEFGLGGFAAWRLGPEYPDFIDGRFDHLAPAVLVQERSLISQPPDSPVWQAAADQWRIEVLLILEGGGRAIARQNALALCQSVNWRPVYMDEVSLVLLRNTPDNRPWLDRLQIDCLTQPLRPPESASRKDLYDFWSDAGGLLLSLQRDSEAETAFLRAAQLYPQDPGSRLLLGGLYHRHGMTAKAESEYRASLALGEDAGAWHGLASLYAGQQRFAEAEQALSRAARLEVSPFATYLDLARIELLLQRPEAALQALNKCVASSPFRGGAEAQAPKLYADIADARADAHRLLSRLPEAIEYEQESVRLNPWVASRWNKLAGLLASAGRQDEAQQAGRRAQELQSSSVHE